MEYKVACAHVRAAETICDEKWDKLQLAKSGLCECILEKHCDVPWTEVPTYGQQADLAILVNHLHDIRLVDRLKINHATREAFTVYDVNELAYFPYERVIKILKL